MYEQIKEISADSRKNKLTDHDNQEKKSFFLIQDPEALRSKISGFQGIWLRRWRHFLDEAALEQRSIRWYGGPDLPLHAAFAWVVTGEDRWRDVARRDFLWMRDKYNEVLKLGLQDSDTWMYAAPMARRAIAFDWLWDSGAFSEEERSSLVEHFITDSLKYPYVTLHHRVPPHANNQGLAMALNLFVVGYLFGQKRGNDPRAKHLMEFSLAHLHQQIGYLPPDGYSGEGSTYIVQVADPLMALACAVLEAATGENYFDREFAPNQISPEKILRLNAKLIPPSGLLPAWDQHGYHLQKAGTTAAFLSHRTDKASYYQPYLFGDGWEFSGSFAWMNDDHVWQLLWMPDPANSVVPENTGSCYPTSWAENHVAGALLDQSANKHLFQMWDISGPRPVRGHMNPNSLLLEAWGSVLTVDGNAAKEGFTLDADPRMQFVHWAMTPPTRISWAAGCLAAHSTIWVDGKIEHTSEGGGFQNSPELVSTGHLLRFEQTEGLQVLAADVAPFYSNTFDIQFMIRTSALVEEAFWVILDQIKAGSSHDYTWQLVLRHGAKKTKYGARLVTSEAVVLDIFHPDGLPSSLDDVEGYPSLLEKRCHHLRKHAHGESVEFTTVLIPQLARRQLADWTSGWRGQRDPDEMGLRNQWQMETGLNWNPMELTDVYFVKKERNRQGVQDATGVWFVRTCEVPCFSRGKLLLELPRTYSMELWIDGQSVDIPLLESSHHKEPRLQAPFVDVSRYLEGKARVRITLRVSRQGKLGLTGSVKLHEALDVEEPVVERLGSGDLLVVYPGFKAVVDMGKLRTQPARLKRGSANGEDPVDFARKVIGKFAGNKAAIINWEGDAATRQKACVMALGHNLPDVEDNLLDCCDDKDWVTRFLAVRALGELRSKRAVPKLVEMLQSETPERIWAEDNPAKYRVAEMCIVALRQIGDSRAAPVLASMLVPETFYGIRRLAADSLGKLGDKSVVPALRKWSQDSDPETKAATQRSLKALEPNLENVCS